MIYKIVLIIAMLFSICNVWADEKVTQAHLEEFETIQRNIERYHPSHWKEYKRVSGEALRQDAMIQNGDRTPVDVIIRRSMALGKKLDLKNEIAELQKLAVKNHGELTIDEQKTLFLEIAKVRRQIMFKNPLLDFNALVFLKHDRMERGESHMCDQYLGLNQKRGGGVYRLDNIFSDQPKVTDLLAGASVQNGRLKGKALDFNSGAFISLELDYDAQRMLFAFSEIKWEGWENPENWKNQPWTKKQAAGQKHSLHYCWKPESSFHIFQSDINGDNLSQLTDGMMDDFDPCYLPSGRITFISARAGGNQRCGTRYLPTYTLYGMMPDGSDIQQSSFHDTNEWFPSVNRDGMIIYTRWDYVDRNADAAHHLWFCNPDGRDPRSMHGNYPVVLQHRPWFEGHVRSIPGSKKYIGVAAPHHGETYGSLILIDQSIPDDGAMAQVKRVTPLSAFPESETTPGKGGPVGRTFGMISRGYQLDWHYSTPWALSEDLYLCVYDPEGTKHFCQSGEECKDNYGIYLVDSYGNRELIYRDSAISCLDPIPLRSRKRPPVIPVKTKQMIADREPGDDLSTGTIAVMNVYESEYSIPDSVKIKELRIINLFPKNTYYAENPRIGVGDESLARGVLGTVPVEEDGSAYFQCPTGASIYFQALDENGMMVQNMRSATYLHPGEQLTCIGCHENKWKEPKTNRMPKAIQRLPSKIKPEASGSYPLTFPRLVQPVLDKHCVSCHKEKAPGKSLRGDRFVSRPKKGDNIEGWSEAMATLKPYAWAKHGRNWGLLKNKRSYSLPMQEGAYDSKLYKILKKGHGNVKLTAEEMRRITLWLDCNSNFYGAYEETEKQAKGEIVIPKEGLPEWSKPNQFVH